MKILNTGRIAATLLAGTAFVALASPASAQSACLLDTRVSPSAVMPKPARSVRFPLAVTATAMATVRSPMAYTPLR